MEWRSDGVKFIEIRWKKRNKKYHKSEVKTAQHSELWTLHLREQKKQAERASASE